MQEVRTDVVVVGAGNAALVAALAAHDAGASVTVLEAAPYEERGGNSRFSGAIFRCAHQGMESVQDILTDEARQWVDKVELAPYTADQFYDDIMTTSGGRANAGLIRTVADRSMETVRWMHEHGVRWELAVGKLIDPEKVGQTRYVLPPGGAVRAEHEGVGLVECLFRAVEERGIEVWYDSPGYELTTQGSTVLGVRVRRQDEYVDLLGTVVLASGGFEANPEMRLRYLGPGWDLVKVRGTRFNMGTMLTQSLLAGAQPSGHWGGCHASPNDADAPNVGDLRLTDKVARYSYPFSIMVNTNAQRFVDEGETHVWLTYAKTGSAIRAQPQALAFQIFDQKTVHLLEPRYSTGTPVVAHTLSELAQKLGLNPDALKQTVREFNTAVPDDAEARFNPFAVDGVGTTGGLQPSKSNWAQRIDTPPYVVYKVTCGITFTFGGLKVDGEARVLDTEGKPMPGLYAAGEIAGDFFYYNYPAGSGLMRGAVFGRIAGEQAARRALQEATA